MWKKVPVVNNSFNPAIFFLFLLAFTQPLFQIILVLHIVFYKLFSTFQ